jgi:hypothetical protein
LHFRLRSRAPLREPSLLSATGPATGSPKSGDRAFQAQSNDGVFDRFAAVLTEMLFFRRKKSCTCNYSKYLLVFTLYLPRSLNILLRLLTYLLGMVEIELKCICILYFYIYRSVLPLSIWRVVFFS